MDTQNPININISKDTTQSNDKYNEFKEYIIRNNIDLQNELKETRDKVKVLEAEISEKEDTEDKYDNRTRYMKGLLQNLHELNKEYSRITEKTIEKSEIIYACKEIDTILYKKTFINNILINYSLVYLYLFIGGTSFINIALNSMLFATIIYCINEIKKDYNTYKHNNKNLKDNNRDLDNKINEIRETIKKTEESSLSLDNWIGEL